MTDLLEKAFTEAAKLPAAEQDALAERILAELASERRWDELFESSQDLLEKLANEARADRKAGRTIPVERSKRKR
jgi:hypothetical protein